MRTEFGFKPKCFHASTIRNFYLHPSQIDHSCFSQLHKWMNITYQSTMESIPTLGIQERQIEIPLRIDTIL